MDKKVCGIYSITNIVNGKKYIGQSVDIQKSRWKNHIWMLKKNSHYNRHLQNSWNKYGEDKFLFTIIEECDIDQLDDREKYYIGLYKSYIPEFGYNGNLGGQEKTGHIPTEETRKRMSEAHKGIRGTLESRLKQSIALTGSRNYNYGRFGALHPKYGKHVSEETRKKIRDSWTDERKRKQSVRVSGDNNPMKHCTGSLNPAAKSVVCMNNQKVFETLKSAALWCGIKDPYYISRVCMGQSKFSGRHPITNEKLVWMYFDDYKKNITNHQASNDCLM